MDRPPLKEYLTRFLIVLGTEHTWSRLNPVGSDTLSGDKMLMNGNIYRWGQLADEGWLESIEATTEHRGGFRLTQKAMDLIKEKNDGDL